MNQKPTKTHQQIFRQATDVETLLAREARTTRNSAELLMNARRVILLGIGTSYHAALVGGWLLRAVGLDACAIHAFDFAHYPDSHQLRHGDACIILGHTGKTKFTRASLDRAVDFGVPCIAIGSTMAEHPGAQLIVRTVESEISTTYTTSHLSAMTALAMIATELAALRGIAIASDLRSALSLIPGQVQSILDRASEIDPIAELAVQRRIYAIGAGPNEATATELMIKVREAAFRPIDGMAAEQFLHGPMVAVNADDLAIAINVPGPSSVRIAEIIRTLRAIQAQLWTVGRSVDGVEVAHFSLPDVPEVVSPLITVVPMQILASKMADLVGANPDEFRTDDPIYGRAFDLLTF